MCEFEIILVNKAPVETFSFLVEVAVAIIRQELILKVLFHKHKVFVLVVLDFFIYSSEPTMNVAHRRTWKYAFF